MSEKLKNIAVVVLTASVLFGLFVWCIIKPADTVSLSERRPLAAMPTLSAQSLLDGRFMTAFSDYAVDQFPMRDSFRSLKAFSALHLMHNMDVNSIYRNSEGYLSKLEYPMNEDSLQNAADKFQRVYEKYLNQDGIHVYLSIIPDKNYFMAADCGALTMDYDAFAAYLRARTDGMQYIDLYDCLALDDYYKTDTHWRQERILGVAETLADAMGASLSGQFKTQTMKEEFRGVYSGQSAMPSSPEVLCCLMGGPLDHCTVFDYETNSEIPVYDTQKAAAADPYEIFLSGPKSLLKITNPMANRGKRLILFRDSFGSSLAPLLVSGYSEIILIDLRYISSDLLGDFVSFENCDVLFLYSTLILNNSVTLK